MSDLSRPPSEPDVPEPGPRSTPPPAGTPSAVGDEVAAQAAPHINRSLPPDPAAFDSPRASLARARGLSAPYIAGGRDPEPDVGRRQERLYGRLLIAMVVVIVLSGFILGILGNVLTALRGG